MRAPEQQLHISLGLIPYAPWEQMQHKTSMSSLLVLARVLPVAASLDLKSLLWTTEAEVLLSFPNLCEVLLPLLGFSSRVCFPGFVTYFARLSAQKAPFNPGAV